jgi:hypothetical protein
MSVAVEWGIGKLRMLWISNRDGSLRMAWVGEAPKTARTNDSLLVNEKNAGAGCYGG